MRFVNVETKRSIPCCPCLVRRAAMACSMRVRRPGRGRSQRAPAFGAWRHYPRPKGPVRTGKDGISWVRMGVNGTKWLSKAKLGRSVAGPLHGRGFGAPRSDSRARTAARASERERRCACLRCDRPRRPLAPEQGSASKPVFDWDRSRFGDHVCRLDLIKPRMPTSLINEAPKLTC